MCWSFKTALKKLVLGDGAKSESSSLALPCLRRPVSVPPGLSHTAVSSSFSPLTSSHARCCPYVPLSSHPPSLTAVGAWEETQDQSLKQPDLYCEIVNLHTLLSGLHLQRCFSWVIKKENVFFYWKEELSAAIPSTKTFYPLRWYMFTLSVFFCGSCILEIPSQVDFHL